MRGLGGVAATWEPEALLEAASNSPWVGLSPRKQGVSNRIRPPATGPFGPSAGGYAPQDAEQMGRRRREAAAKARRRRLAVGTTVFLAIVLSAAGLLLTRLAGEQAPVLAREEPQAAAYRWQPDSNPDPDTPLPAFATADPEVELLYRFALARPDVLSYIPCTCGCRAAGHLSNWNCYITQVRADGTVVFDDMAPG